VAGFLTGVLTVFFEVAYRSLLPALVSREQLVEGNSKLEVSRSGAGLVGPGLAGMVVARLGTHVAMLIDAVSFLVSALFLARIRVEEPAAGATHRSVWGDVGEGLRVVLGSRLLRSLAACTPTLNLFGSFGNAVFILFATRELGLGPAVLGWIFAVGNVGFLLGAVAASRIPSRIGLGPTIGLSALLIPVGALLIALAGGPWSMAAAVTALGQFITSLGAPIYNVNQVSLRQALVPPTCRGG